MAKIEPFEKYLNLYEDWFVQNRFSYQSEVEAVRLHVPKKGLGLEIGVGSGLFAEPLGIQYGVEPSTKMFTKASKRGVKVVAGVAEKLPFIDNSYDFVLMVTTICFLDDIIKSFEEARRVIKPKGKLIIGFVDKNSPIGKIYQKYKHQNVFYRFAKFYSVSQITDFLNQTNFNDFHFTQTIFQMLDQIKKVEKIKTGFGHGSFVVVSGIKR